MARYWRCEVCGKEYLDKFDPALQIIQSDLLKEFDSKACVTTYLASVKIVDLPASSVAAPATQVAKPPDSNLH